MGALIIFIIILAGIAALTVYGRHMNEAGSRPRLRRDFKRLRKSILKRVSKARRSEIKELLTKCESYLENLSGAQYEHDVIQKLIANAEQLSGVEAREARGRSAQVQAELGRRLADLFAGLSRLSATAGLGTTDTVGELQDLTSSFEFEHDAFLQLTRELSHHELGVRQEVS